MCASAAHNASSLRSLIRIFFGRELFFYNPISRITFVTHPSVNSTSTAQGELPAIPPRVTRNTGVCYQLSASRRRRPSVHVWVKRACLKHLTVLSRRKGSFASLGLQVWVIMVSWCASVLGCYRGSSYPVSYRGSRSGGWAVSTAIRCSEGRRKEVIMMHRWGNVLG